MKLNKEKFLKTEFGIELQDCIVALDYYTTKRKSQIISNDFDELIACYQAQWAVYKLAIKQFYGIEYYLSRTDEYFGLVTEDETDWLLKIERLSKS